MALVPILIGASGDVDKYSAFTTAEIIADVPSTSITADLKTGAYGTLVFNSELSGTGVVFRVMSGDTLRLPLKLTGSGTALYSIANASLQLRLGLSGVAAAASVNVEAESHLILNPKILGRGLVGNTATGSLTLAGFNISSSTIFLVPTGVGNGLTFSLEIDGASFAELFDCLVMNTRNFALTEYDFGLNSLVYFNGVHLGASRTSLYELTGTKDDSASIDWYFTTGKLDLEKDRVNRLRYAWLSYKPSGDLILTVDDGINTYEYEVYAYGEDDNAVRVKIGKGIKAKYVQVKLSSTAYETIFLDRLRLFTEPVAKKR